MKKPKIHRSAHIYFMADMKEVNLFRESIGLPPVQFGNIKCMNCKSVFFSEDIKNQRLCPSCIEKPYRDFKEKK